MDDSRSDFKRRPPQQQVALCIHALEAEINNGGFHQFFGNSSGAYVPETLTALISIGALKTHALLEQAISIAYPEGYPANPEEHLKFLTDATDDVLDALSPLDRKFFAYDDAIADLVNTYLGYRA